ncbi:SWIM zinc finger family protein [Pedosphaera parvula]|uniref:Zinc finger SWIM domain protein n=1 Tax=Pedosphaera parvula (strain Ellin514) TaxID=320771 RepID=B9XDN9_PEDPL|nr:SWIM zinc finger family protein [Pedosphaera parvula]EEF62185.1 zinc finger SWIM domain protein [Pedosphaera parvula Ellin514]
MDTWTTEKVLSLAPDASSAKSGKELASPRKWVSMGRDGQSAWGLCQGSGKNPYQASIDLNEPAFKCTCPSRKFPCKHSLGLFLILAGQPGAVAEGTPPDWVNEWLAGRTQRAEKKVAKAQAGEKISDPEAQKKRVAEREAKVSAGLKELEIWMSDLVRQGLAGAQGRPNSFWESTAARMIDAQAPGIARRVRELSGIPASGEGWPERLLEQLGRLHLLREGFQRIETLSVELQNDIRTLIGWTQNQDELLGNSGVKDEWLVLGRTLEEEDKIRVQRTWLHGKQSGRNAMHLHFAHLTQPLDTSLVPGTAFEGEVVYFPSAYPMRAIIKERGGVSKNLDGIPGQASIADLMAAYAEALAMHPWIEQFPMRLSAVVPVRRDERWQLRDGEGRCVPLTPSFAKGWELLAMSGGRAVTVFGEWDGDFLQPVSVSAEGRFAHLWSRKQREEA